MSRSAFKNINTEAPSDYLADGDDRKEAREAFRAVAGAGKGHLRSLVKALTLCR